MTQIGNDIDETYGLKPFKKGHVYKTHLCQTLEDEVSVKVTSIHHIINSQLLVFITLIFQFGNLSLQYKHVYIYTGWWFGTCFIFHNIWDVVLPIDFHIFQAC